MKNKLYLEPLGENGLPLHNIANIDKCMKSYKKVVGVFVDLPAMNTISKEERKQIVLEWKNKIAEKKNC